MDKKFRLDALTELVVGDGGIRIEKPLETRSIPFGEIRAVKHSWLGGTHVETSDGTIKLSNTHNVLGARSLFKEIDRRWRDSR